VEISDDKDPGCVLDDESRPFGEEMERHAGYTSRMEPFLGI
jgi:hypothetical protein